MGGARHPAQGGGQTVDGPQPGVGQRDPAEEACRRHVFPTAAVGSVGHRGRKRPGGVEDPRAAEGIGQGVRLAADEGLDQLGEGVHAGRGRSGRR